MPIDIAASARVRVVIDLRVEEAIEVIEAALQWRTADPQMPLADEHRLISELNPTQRSGVPAERIGLDAESLQDGDKEF